MSAETLRRAAALMRVRAEAVENPAGDALIESWVAACAEYIPGADGEFVASWHPAVALAVADWLEREAALHEILAATGELLNAASEGLGYGEVRIQFTDTNDQMAASTMPQALAVARAYLGES